MCGQRRFIRALFSRADVDATVTLATWTAAKVEKTFEQCLGAEHHSHGGIELAFGQLSAFFAGEDQAVIEELTDRRGHQWERRVERSN